MFEENDFLDGNKYKNDNVSKNILCMINLYYKEIEKNSLYISHILSAEDYKLNMKNKKISSLLTIEGIGMVDNKLSLIEKLYNKGVRLMTLTWNYENCLGYPNSTNRTIMNKGLKPFGIKAIKYMEELGVIIDVSHLSDGGFYDVFHNTSKPFIASHSNARAVTNHPRNLTDDMIRCIAERNGVIGINFCPKFLNDNTSNSLVDDMIRHINHIVSVGGIDCVAIGSDFDGIEGVFEIKDISKMYILKNELLRVGYSIEEIEKIWYKNAERVICEVFQ